MSSADSHVGKVGNIGVCLPIGYLNGLSLVLGLNLRLEIPSYRFLSSLSVLFFKGVLLVIYNPVSGVSEGLINFPSSGSVQGLLSSSFNNKKFNSDIFSGIPNVFQKDVLLSGILLELGLLVSSRVLSVTQLLALTNFRISTGS